MRFVLASVILAQSGGQIADIVYFFFGARRWCAVSTDYSECDGSSDSRLPTIIGATLGGIIVMAIIAGVVAYFYLYGSFSLRIPLHLCLILRTGRISARAQEAFTQLGLRSRKPCTNRM
jgi:hypothetical protein